MNDSYIERLEMFATICYPSKKSFCDEADINPQHLSAFLNGSRKPSFEIMMGFTHAGMNTDWLLTGKGNMFNMTNNGMRIKSDIRKKLILQLIYTHTGRIDFNKEAFIENFERFACLLGKDDFGYKEIVDFLNKIDVKELYYPGIKKYVLAEDITKEMLSAIFDSDFIEKNPNFVNQLQLEWLPSRPVPAYIPNAIWDNIDYSLFYPLKRKFRVSKSIHELMPVSNNTGGN